MGVSNGPFPAVLVCGALALTTVAGAMAHDPGNDHPGFPPGQFLPQGPKQIACDNNEREHPSGHEVTTDTDGSGWGVYNAIDRHDDHTFDRNAHDAPGLFKPIHCETAEPSE